MAPPLAWNETTEKIRKYQISLTDTVDEYAGKYQIEDVEHGSTSESYLVSDVRIRFRAARVILHVPSRGEIDQVEFTVRLIIAHVSLLALLLQLQLYHQPWRFSASFSATIKAVEKEEDVINDLQKRNHVSLAGSNYLSKGRGGGWN